MFIGNNPSLQIPKNGLILDCCTTIVVTYFSGNIEIPFGKVMVLKEFGEDLVTEYGAEDSTNEIVGISGTYNFCKCSAIGAIPVLTQGLIYVRAVDTVEANDLAYIITEDGEYKGMFTNKSEDNELIGIFRKSSPTNSLAILDINMTVLKIK